MPKVRTQADRRKHAAFTDQHGRKWFAVIEKDTMHPAGAITPKGWLEPEGCIVPDCYKTFPDLQDPFMIVIAYDEWITALEVAEEDYHSRAATSAAFMHPDDSGASLFRMSDNGDVYIAPALKRMVGKPPAPVDLVRAMRSGNKWALGLLNPATGNPYPRPSWAEKFVPVVAVEKDQFPDADEFPDDEGFEDAGQSEAAEFPDEEAGRLSDEEESGQSDEEIDESNDPLGHLSRILSKPVVKSVKPTVKPAAKRKHSAPKKAAPTPTSSQGAE